MELRSCSLILSDGSVFPGQSFGYEADTVGEIVFNTAMVGYPESLTDPSYAGQILVFTFPLIGNYGVPPFTFRENGLPDFMEGDRIFTQAIVVSDYCEKYSHWNAVESLSTWLKREKVPGITGVDTRRLTKILRENGVMMGRIVFGDTAGVKVDASEMDYSGTNYVDLVSCKEIILYKPDGTAVKQPAEGPVNLPKAEAKRILLLDCGVKANIIRSLIDRGVEVLRVPWNYDFNQLEFDGLFISNGPGNPDNCSVAVENIRKAMENEKLPIFGICMGNQLLAKAGGAKVYKLKYGHRSHNQPVRMVGTNRCYVTSQNHGFAVDNNTLGDNWEPFFINMNDGSNEGIRHKTNPWFSVQFHPEATSGPTDTGFLFDHFLGML